jgi:hypothetical protein
MVSAELNRQGAKNAKKCKESSQLFKLAYSSR